MVESVLRLAPATGLLLFWLFPPMVARETPPGARVHVTESFLAGQVLHRGEPPQIKPEAFRVGFAEVVLSVDVDARGSAQDWRVLEGPALLRRAATECVAQWKFRPFLDADGQTHTMTGRVTVFFQLRPGNRIPGQDLPLVGMVGEERFEVEGKELSGRELAAWVTAEKAAERKMRLHVLMDESLDPARAVAFFHKLGLQRVCIHFD